MPKHNGHVSDSVEIAVLQDLADEKPTQKEWADWAKAKSYKYGVSDVAINKIVALHKIELSQAIGSHTQKYAERIAEAFALSVAEAFQVMKEGMKANKVFIRTDKNGKLTEKIYEPDWRARLSSAELVVKARGGFPAQEIHVEHGVSEDLYELKKGELQARAAELFAELRKDPEFRRSLNEAEGIIDIEAITAEPLESESTGTPGNTGEAEGEAGA